MLRERELSLGDRLRNRIESGPPPAAEPHATIDASRYRDPEVHAGEVAAIRSHPVAALASTELPGPGTFATVELLGQHVIATRDREGEVHAMYNACAHRGATVETRGSGSARVLSCGFHGWSYDLDGSLRAVSDAGLFSSETCTRGLATLACVERHGVVWITPDATADTPGVGDWLGPEVDGLLSDLGMGEMVHHAATEYDLACNWKLLTDGFLEIYHLKYLHRNSIAPFFPANTTLYESAAPHFYGWLPKNRLARELLEEDRDTWEVLAGLTGAVVLVPGTVVQWQAGHIELFSLRPHPTDPSRTTVRLTMLVPGERAGETELWDRNWERVCATIPDEDFAAAVDVQANIDSGLVDSIQIGANERLLIEHLDAVRDCAIGS